MYIPDVPLRLAGSPSNGLDDMDNGGEIVQAGSVSGHDA